MQFENISMMYIQCVCVGLVGVLSGGGGGG